MWDGTGRTIQGDERRVGVTFERRCLAVLACAAITTGACGGGDEPADADPADVGIAADADDATGPAGAPPGFEGLADGLELVDGLIPELADLPVPDDVAFMAGQAYTAEQDPRETAVQRVFFLLEPREVAEFYLTELTDDGYTVSASAVRTIDPTMDEALAQVRERWDEVEAMGQGFSVQLQLDGPDGIPLNLNIGPSGVGVPTSVNVNRFMSGTG